MPNAVVTTIKTNPLPNGVYWIDVFRPSSSSPGTRDGEPHWQKWAGENRASVVTLNAEVHEEPLTGGPLRTFRVFRVTAPPTPFPFAALGFPAIAERPDITSQHTTTNTPEPSFDPFAALGGAAVAGALIVIGLAMYSRKD